MIKFKASRSGRSLLGFGLSAGNVKRLQEGKPIHIFGEEIGIEHDILIFYGETEQAMAEDLKSNGFIGSETVVREDKTKQ